MRLAGLVEPTGLARAGSLAWAALPWQLGHMALWFGI